MFDLLAYKVVGVLYFGNKPRLEVRLRLIFVYVDII